MISDLVCPNIFTGNLQFLYSIKRLKDLTNLLWNSEKAYFKNVLWCCVWMKNVLYVCLQNRSLTGKSPLKYQFTKYSFLLFPEWLQISNFVFLLNEGRPCCFLSKLLFIHRIHTFREKYSTISLSQTIDIYSRGG